MSVRKPLTAVALAAAALCSAIVYAQSQKTVTDADTAKRLMHERHENFEKIGEAFKVVRDELRAPNTNMQAIQSSAQTINDMAKLIPTWFPAGTGPETGIETEAKAEIWQDKAGFEAAAQRLQEESEKFLALTATGDSGKIAGGVRGLGGACKNCHDNYRVDED